MRDKAILAAAFVSIAVWLFVAFLAARYFLALSNAGITGEDLFYAILTALALIVSGFVLAAFTGQLLEELYGPESDF